MKKFLIYLIIISFSSPCNADIQINSTNSSPNDGLNYLRNEIRKLETELNTKTDKLNKCAAKNKNFKIAGVTTVGLTGVGVATNVSLHSKIKDQKNLVANLNNKIKTADAETNKLIQEIQELGVNADVEKCQKEIAEKLTPAEISRLEYFANTDENELGLSESDKVLVEKCIRILRQCQK